MGNPRNVRIGEQIKKIASSYLELRLKDPRLGFVTITDVRMTGDGREASLFYTCYGSDAERAESAEALHDARGQIRTAVGRQLGLKHTPSITFIADAVPETAAEIEAVLAKARQSDADVAAKAAGAAYAGESDPYKKPQDEDDEDAGDAE